MDANGISIHYQVAGSGPSVVLLHEMGGTLASWDSVAPELSKSYRTLRYDQRGSGLTEKMRQPVTTEMLVDDLEAVLQQSGLPPPYHFVTVAAATMQALLYSTKYPDRVASFTFCNPFTGADPKRVSILNERADRSAREGMRATLSMTLDNSWPADVGDPEAYATYRGRYLAHDPVCFAALNRSIASPDVTHLGAKITKPTMVVGGTFDKVRPPAACQQFAATIPGARFEVIDAVHMMPAQAPKPLLALLQDFLGQHRS